MSFLEVQHNPLWDNDWLIGCVTLSSLIPPYPPRLWWLCCVLMLICCHQPQPGSLCPGGCVWRKLKTTASDISELLRLMSPLLVTGPGCLANTNQYSAYFSWSVKFLLASALLSLLSLLPWHQINCHLSPQLLWPAIVISARTGSGLQFT